MRQVIRAFPSGRSVLHPAPFYKVAAQAFEDVVSDFDSSCAVPRENWETVSGS